MKRIGELQSWILAELIMQYDVYITEFFDEGLHEEDTRPVTVHQFYENDFLGYAEEKGFAYLLSETQLDYRVHVVDQYKIQVQVKDFKMGLTLPPLVIEGGIKTIREYVEKYYGDTILNVMKSLQ